MPLLKDKVIFITGGSAGIGAECASTYAREGATVALCGIDEEEAREKARSLGKAQLGFRCDVSLREEVRDSINLILQKYGRLDAIHNNAGIASPGTRPVAALPSRSGKAMTLSAGQPHSLPAPLQGRDIEVVMAGFGAVQCSMADEQQFRWLGPHKGVVHLALAAVTNACWDLWAKKRGLPLWKLLLELTDEEVLATLDLSYVDDQLPRATAIRILSEARRTRPQREPILNKGYPGYDTSVGWFNYSDEQVRENCRKSVARGFTAMKLKVGSSDPDRDIRRAAILREAAGEDATIMLDANQQWSLNQALEICPRFLSMRPFWIEEPTHPDDVAAHRSLARTIAPTPLALGEHVPNRIVFKNYLLAQCCGFVQVDALRVAGVSEFVVVSLLARKFGLPVVPHVGDMGQLHQHLVLFNHIALDLPALFLEHIPHLRDHFRLPVQVSDGLYRVPQEPGAHCDLIQTDR